jgi:hypothetical protein
VRVQISCDGVHCDATVTLEGDAPGWVSHDHDIETGGDSSYTFCPACAPQREWFRSVCPGCVSGFRGCGLDKAYAFGRQSPGLTAEQRATIRGGRCPFRINGSMTFSRSEGIRSVDISDRAPTPAGEAVLAGIDSYVETYPIGPNAPRTSW